MAGMNVRKVPVLHNGKPVRGKWLLEDDRNGEALPGIVVGDDFTPYQYEQVAEVLDVVARRTGAVFDRAGYMDVTSYGLGGANHMRMNIATSRKVLKAALDSMAAATKKISA